MENETKCYLCGTVVDPRRDRDHVPPRGFFPDPKPHDLITVPCCQSCNRSNSKDDEAIRAIFSCAIGRSHAGDRIWEEKVIPGTIARSAAFREDMLSRVQDIDMDVGGRRAAFPALVVPDERVNPFIIRITKGLLAHFYPHVDYCSHTFDVRPTSLDKTALDNLGPLLQCAKQDRRGEGVFTVFHAITDTGRGGFWLHGYYEAIWYAVFHRNNGDHVE